jgi:hypothetical protein
MLNFENYSEQEYSLHEIISWAMLGLIDTINPERPDTFAGFLDDLYSGNGNSHIFGEPGWSLERIQLERNFESKYQFIQPELLVELNALFLDNETEAFLIDNLTSDPRTCVLDSSSFWSVVSEAFAEFVTRHPEKTEEFERAKLKYPQLSRRG